MGLADWGDDDKLNKKISKQTSRRTFGNEIRQWIKEIYFNNRPVKLLEVKVNVVDSGGYEGVVSYVGNFVIKGRRRENVNYEICDKYNCVKGDFVNIVKSVHSKKVLPSLETVYGKEYDKCVFILSDIPIHFGKQKDYEGYDDGKYLGLYRRNKDNTREIILFEDAIKDVAKRDEDYLKNLIWKVIIHEYAHAIMDAIFHNDDDELRKQDSKLYKYREESLANAFALKVLGMSIENKLITNSEFSKIENFVEDYQPEEYRHGLYLYNKCGDLLKMMEFWREMKVEGNKRF